MSIESPIILTLSLSGIVFLLGGIVLAKFPPKKINGLYGYRTVNSMKSQDRWDFAQKYSSRLAILSGLALILTSFLWLLLMPKLKFDTWIGFIIILISIGIIIVKTEIAIGKFKNGV